MGKLKFFKLYFLFIFIILFIPNVFASTDVNINSTIKFPYNGSNGTYQGVEIYNSGGAFTYNIGTRYNGKLSTINFYSSYSFDTNTTYTITLNMATNDWRNSFMGPQVYRANSDGSIPSTATNWAGNSSITFVSRQKIKFNFTTGSTIGPLTKFTIYSTNSNETPFTGESNWNLSSIILTIPTGSSGGSSGGGTSSDSTNQDIINNSNQNTQDIINNNNDNSNSIIENNNNNTQDIINNNNENLTCPVGPLELTNSEWGVIEKKFLSSDGTETSNNSYSISPYFVVKPSTEYIISLSTASNNVYYCLYTSNKTLISCSNYSSTTITFNTTSSTQYLRLSLGGSRVLSLKGPVCNNWEKEGLSNVANSINDVNDSINNSNVDSNTGTSFFNDFENEDFGLSQIITLPLSTIQSLTSKTCSPLSVPIPFTNSSVNLPCMTQIYNTHFPTIYNLWKIVSFGIIAYFIAIDIFHIVKGFKDPESDKVEVLDL